MRPAFYAIDLDGTISSHQSVPNGPTIARYWDMERYPDTAFGNCKWLISALNAGAHQKQLQDLYHELVRESELDNDQRGAMRLFLGIVPRGT